MSHLEGTKVALVATNGFEDSELTKPLEALREHGADVTIIAPESGTITGKQGTEIEVDSSIVDVDAAEFDALLLPGGVQNPDLLRVDESVVDFVREFFEGGKPVAAICHAPWLLIEAGVVSGRKLTSWPSLKTDLKNAGATWVDEEVVVDQGLVTSRKPDDLPAFCDKMLEEFGEGKHEGQTA